MTYLEAMKMLLETMEEPPNVLLGLSPSLLLPVHEKEVPDMSRYAVGQISPPPSLPLFACDGSHPITAMDSSLQSQREGEDSEEQRGVVCVDLGSLTEWIVDTFSLDLFLESLLQLRKRFRFLVICHGHLSVFAAALQRSRDGRDAAGVELVGGEWDHRLVFRRCVSVISHGGVGTVNTCLLVGIPQGVV